MYQINSQNTTGQSPETRINYSEPNTYRNLISSAIKGSRSWISAFMVLITFLSISGCDNEGVVGEGLNPGGERIETNTYFINNIEVLEGNSFSGRLGNSAVGIVDDPAYGTIISSSLLKPTINPTGVDEMQQNYTLKLQIEFNPLKYGEENSVSEYEIYEISERWRGQQITYNNPILIDVDSQRLGSFQVTDETSVEVAIDEDWVDRYRKYFNSEAADRDSVYRFQFHGLAVVPANQNRKIDFMRHEPASSDTAGTRITRFLMHNEQDSLIADIPLLDFGTSMERTDVPERDGNFVLHNTMENILKVDLGIDPEEFRGKEIVNAQIIFDIDPTPSNTVPPGFTRPGTDLVRYHFFRSDPLDLSSELFARSPANFASLNEEQQQFKLNVSNYFIDTMFGDIELTPLYFTNQSNNGLFYSTTLLGTEAPENQRPRLIITTINPEN